MQGSACSVDSPLGVERRASQRSQPFAILTRIRRILYDEFDKGKFASHMHYVTEMDLNAIDATISSCERLFSSPIPPNMARHGMRSLMLWLLALPVVLAGSVPPALIVLWAASTSYIFLGRRVKVSNPGLATRSAPCSAPCSLLARYSD